MNQAKIVILDYGIGNLFNLQRAFDSLDIKTQISDSKHVIAQADKLVLPGVGAFSAGMEHLRSHDMLHTLDEFRKTGKPLLGICLGMQLLMSRSYEDGTHTGLAFVPGEVRRFRAPQEGGTRFKIPQISWNSLEYSNTQASAPWQGSVLQGLSLQSYFYFVHSYYVQVEDSRDSLAQTHYGLDVFDSVIRRENVMGCQFHPEISGEAGLHILKNFAAV